jgi:hypothetical protein
MIFDPLTAGTLLVMATASGHQLCQMPKPTEIEVIPHASPVEFDYSQSLEDLQGIETDTIDPLAFNGISIHQGYMKSSIRVQPHIKLGTRVYQAYDAVCVWYDTITIDIEIDPTITIAREVADDDCMGEAVRNHEMKHVRALRKVVNKYADSMGREVYEQLKERGFVAGPAPQKHAEQIADRMYKTVEQVIELEYKKMEIENAEAQGQIDSREEYEYISGLCPDFNPLYYQQKRRN